MRITCAIFPFMFVGIAALVGDASVGTSLADADLGVVSGGAFTRCQDPGAPGGSYYVACNECYQKVRCTSVDLATKCKAYTNPYACVECEDVVYTCTGIFRSYPLDGCSGPPTDGAACTRTIWKANFQTCSGQCP